MRAMTTKVLNYHNTFPVEVLEWKSSDGECEARFKNVILVVTKMDGLPRSIFRFTPVYPGPDRLLLPWFELERTNIHELRQHNPADQSATPRIIVDTDPAVREKGQYTFKIRCQAHFDDLVDFFQALKLGYDKQAKAVAAKKDASKRSKAVADNAAGSKNKAANTRRYGTASAMPHVHGTGSAANLLTAQQAAEIPAAASATAVASAPVSAATATSAPGSVAPGSVPAIRQVGS
ncbi:hypothetical protein GGF32_000511 [Allomyces javanicus]|nr:hypothetical protein GGF32_000511 [Allomyces javanicus]